MHCCCSFVRERAFCCNRIYEVSPLIIITGKLALFYIILQTFFFAFEFSETPYSHSSAETYIQVRVYTDMYSLYAENTFIFWFTVSMFCYCLLLMFRVFKLPSTKPILLYKRSYISKCEKTGIINTTKSKQK